MQGQLQLNDKSTVRPTKDIRRANVVVEVTAQVIGLCTGPRTLLNFFEVSAM
jgi:hypothetical protein